MKLTECQIFALDFSIVHCAVVLSENIDCVRGQVLIKYPIYWKCYEKQNFLLIFGSIHRCQILDANEYGGLATFVFYVWSVFYFFI